MRPCLLSLYFTSVVFPIQYVKERFPHLSGSALNTGVEPVTYPATSDKIAHPLSLFISKKNVIQKTGEPGNQLVEVNGVEPMTPCLQSRCSSQLSYTPKEFSGGISLAIPANRERPAELFPTYEA